jgi:hypothetical protein
MQSTRKQSFLLFLAWDDRYALERRTYPQKRGYVFVQSMGIQPFYDKRPRALLRAVTRAAHGKIITGIQKLLRNFCSIYISYRYGHGPQNDLVN